MISLFKGDAERERLVEILEKYQIGMKLTENLIWYFYNGFKAKDVAQRQGLMLNTIIFYYRTFRRMFESEYCFLLEYFYNIKVIQ